MRPRGEGPGHSPTEQLEFNPHHEWCQWAPVPELVCTGLQSGSVKIQVQHEPAKTHPTFFFLLLLCIDCLKLISNYIEIFVCHCKASYSTVGKVSVRRYHCIDQFSFFLG